MTPLRLASPPTPLQGGCRTPARRLRCDALLVIIYNVYVVMSCLVSDVICCFFNILHSCGLVMFITAPKAPSWVAFSETWMLFKHSLWTPWFQHYFCNRHAIPLWYICLKVNVVPSESYFPELKTMSFEFLESAHASIDVWLFEETIVPAFACKHEGDPVVPWILFIFRAYATQINHCYQSPVAPQKGAALAAPRATRNSRNFHCKNGTADSTCGSFRPRSILGG